MKPRFILSRSKLLKQYSILKRMGLLISYSLKTNPIVGQVLERETDCFFSVHTKEELGFLQDSSRVWFLAESWSNQDIESLISRKVQNFIVYNVNDLNRLLDFLKGTGLKINLLLRVRLRENTIFTGKYFVFGMDARTVNKLLHKLRSHPNIAGLGVHFHRKTQNVSEWNLKYEVENMLKSRALEEIDLLNIGGGLPIKYRNTGDDNLGYIFSRIKELREWLSGFGVKVIIEPGRFLSGPAIKLETRIINIFGKNIVVNCSVYNSSMDTLIVPIKLLVEGELEKGEVWTIKGCTPCSLDIFRYSVCLPRKRVGDKIVFLNAGAYNFYTDFCNLERPETVIVD